MKSAVVLGLLGASASVVSAHPHTKKSTGLRQRAVGVEDYRLPAVSKYSNARKTKSDPTVAKLARRADFVQTATDFVKATMPEAEFRVASDSYVGKNGVAHVYFKQTVHGMDIDNANFNVNIGRDGSVFTHGNNFYTGALPPNPKMIRRAYIEPTKALATAISKFELPISGEDLAEAIEQAKDTFQLTGTMGAQFDPEAKMMYVVNGEGELSLTWRIETDVLDDWLLTYVDASDPTLVHGAVNYVADATYEVYPWGTNDPDEGDRIVVTDPWDDETSEFTWNSDGDTDYDTTRGNNAIAQINHDGDRSYLDEYRPESADLAFEYEYDPSMVNPDDYVDASIAQLFYTANVYHDVTYALGFTEEAGNFEVNNNGQGGSGSDQMILNAQDGSGMNNANFATPPDGREGRMRMYLWNSTSPWRDCTFEAGVVIHEATHGLSNRLTGGPANSNCLGTTEAGGMGEGWSDAFATAVRLKDSDTRDTDYAMGAWISGDPAGIRDQLYSTSMETNDMTYGTTNTQSEVHAIGTVWAEMLYEVMWNLIDKHGLSTEIMPEFDADGVPTDGKFMFLQLMTDGLALQPCSPDFVSARDAILDADEALTGSDNECEIWTAFAKRGLGENAEYGGGGFFAENTEDFTIPSGVC